MVQLVHRAVHEQHPSDGDIRRIGRKAREIVDAFVGVDGSDCSTQTVNRPLVESPVGEAWDLMLPDGGTAITPVAASPRPFGRGVVDRSVFLTTATTRIPYTIELYTEAREALLPRVWREQHT